MDEAMNILGISCSHSDSAAALITDGRIIAASQEERFTRKKNEAGFPVNAVNSCLKTAGIGTGSVSVICFRGEQASFPPGFMRGARFIAAGHKESHAASSFYPSPFREAAFLLIDGAGKDPATGFGTGSGRHIRFDPENASSDPPGAFYSVFTSHLGFRSGSEEYKVMGLAPYGREKYAGLIMNELMDLGKDGSFKLNREYFSLSAGLWKATEKFTRLFGKARVPGSAITRRDIDLARSTQAVLEEIVIRMARHVKEITGKNNLCLAGGTALNCAANGRLLREGLFKNIWIQPAAGEAGCALGAAFIAWHTYLNKERKIVPGRDLLSGSLLGPRYSGREIRDFLRAKRVPFRELKRSEVAPVAAGLIESGKVAGWFCGRMEFGPRALGARSILCDARRPEMQGRLNAEIKFRESFRPFAASVLEDKTPEYFDIKSASPYMLFTAPVRKKRGISKNAATKSRGIKEQQSIIRSDIPAVTHVDYSTRVQTVSRRGNPAFHAVLEAFRKKTGCPAVLNTSFNVRGEPIVCTPGDAFRDFMKTGMDCLFLENFLLEKKTIKQG